MDELIQGILMLIVGLLIAAAAIAIFVLLLSVGGLYGSGVAIYNYFTALTKNVRPELVGPSSAVAMSVADPAIKSYFFGKGYRDLTATIQDCWKANQLFAWKIWADATKAGALLLRAVHYGAAVSCLIYGTAFFAVLSTLHILILGVCFLATYSLFSVLVIVERIYLTLRGFLTVCPTCHAQTRLPVYLCDGCSSEHRRLLPSSFGIFHRKCLCGQRLPTTFFLNRGRLPAKCASCGNFLSRVHTEARKLFVPVIGGPSTGKTAFLVWLVEELQKRSASEGQDIEFLNPTEGAEFAVRLAAMHRGEMPGKTTATTPTAVNLLFKKSGTLHRNLYLYDPAGEAYGGETELIPHRFLAYCSGILLMIDPFSIPNVQEKYRVNPSIADTLKPSLERPDDLLDRLLFVLEKHFGLDPSQQISIPLAAVLTKADAFDLDRLIGDAALSPTAPGHVRISQGSALISNRLRDLGMAPLVEAIESRFAHKCFFSCSSVGLSDNASRSFQPERISRPFLWLMEQANTGLFSPDSPPSHFTPETAASDEKPISDAKGTSTTRIPRAKHWGFVLAALSVVALAISTAFSAKLYLTEQETYENARGDVQKLKSYLDTCRICWMRKEVQTEIATIGPNVDLAEREAVTFRLAHGNIIQLRSYVGSCQICSFKAEAISEIARLQYTNTTQMEATEYQNARGDISRLRMYVNSCQVCQFKAPATEEIARLEDGAQLAAQEEATYRSARGDLILLRNYVSSCKICANKSQALDEIKQLEQDELAGQEARSYQNARGNVDRLREYINTCQICAFKSNALVEIGNLELKAQYFSFEVCNSTNYAISVAIVGRKDANVDAWVSKGWWAVPANSCSPIGRFAKGKFYVMAMVHNEVRGWYGHDTRQCVNFPGPFETNIGTNSSCGTGGKIVGFQELTVTDDQSTWRVVGEPSYSDDEFFTFEVCNKSGRWAAVAISGRETPGSNVWIVQGWWRVSPGQCIDIGRYVRGYFYAMAEQVNSPGRWTGNAARICVEHPGPFKRINTPGYSCGYNDLIPFNSFLVTRANEVWTLMP